MLLVCHLCGGWIVDTGAAGALVVATMRLAVCLLQCSCCYVIAPDCPSFAERRRTEATEYLQTDPLQLSQKITPSIELASFVEDHSFICHYS